MTKPKHGDQFEFEMAVDLYGLIGVEDMECMNNMMDDEFQHQFKWDRLIVTDIEYEPVRLDEDKNIVIKVIGVIEDMDGGDE